MTLLDWENEAAAFLKATGFLRPGKDLSAAMSPTDEYREQCQQAWRIWCAGYDYCNSLLEEKAS